jgi:hypothetical protein
MEPIEIDNDDHFLLECDSCDLTRFRDPIPDLAQMIWDWLGDLRGANYQSADRQRLIFQVIQKTVASKQSRRLIHYFLAIGPIIQNIVIAPGGQQSLASTRDIYACWMMNDGIVYAIDTRNRSETVASSLGMPLPYHDRWSQGGQVDVMVIGTPFEMDDRCVGKAQAIFKTPYLIHGNCACDTLSNHLAYLGGEISKCLDRLRAKMTERTAQGVEIISVSIQITRDNQHHRPNLAIVCLQGHGCSATVNGLMLMSLEDAHAIQDDVPYDYCHDEDDPIELPIRTLRYRYKNLIGNHQIKTSFDLTRSPRIARQLARCRIWHEHRITHPFILELGNEELPIVIHQMIHELEPQTP